MEALEANRGKQLGPLKSHLQSSERPAARAWCSHAAEEGEDSLEADPKPSRCLGINGRLSGEVLRAPAPLAEGQLWDDVVMFPQRHGDDGNQMRPLAREGAGTGPAALPWGRHLLRGRLLKGGGRHRDTQVIRDSVTDTFQRMFEKPLEL